MKFYFVEFKDIETGKVFHKFGYTKETNAQDRFDPYFDNYRFFNDREKYLEFGIRVLFSINGTLEDVMSLEKIFLNQYPKNINLETYLGRPYNYFSTGFSGITEIVALTSEQKSKVLKTLYALKGK